MSTKFGSRRYHKSVPHVQGGVTLIDSIVMAVTTGQNFDQLFLLSCLLTMLSFRALAVDCIEFQLLTVGYVRIYGKTPPLP